ncbi:MAG: hypothetical protein QOF33_3884 [Thermomicrobiales bacterium]|nr:hypothetical protein [Thermomicrobiales bacterium]
MLDRWHPRGARRALERGDVPGAIVLIRGVQALAPREVPNEFVGYPTRLAPRIPDDAASRAATVALRLDVLDGDLAAHAAAWRTP